MDKDIQVIRYGNDSVIYNDESFFLSFSEYYFFTIGRTTIKFYNKYSDIVISHSQGVVGTVYNEKHGRIVSVQ